MNGCPNRNHPLWECRSAIRRFFQSVAVADDASCWRWTGTVDDKDYGRIMVHGKHVRAHVFAWALFNKSAFPDGLDGCHACDNPRCVNPNHIWPGSHAENMADAARKQRFTTRLNVNQVQEIRKRLSGGEKQAKLAREYGVDPSTIHLIHNRKIWAWAA